MRASLITSLTAGAVFALALAACDDGSVRITSTTSDGDAKGVLKVVDALQCPQTQGSLTRKGSAQAEGTVCVYTGPRGAEVSLHLVRLEDGDAASALQRFEQQLAAAMPRAASEIDASRADAAAAEADTARAEADAQAQASASADSAHVRAPGMEVETEGERASVHMPGLHVEADGDRADVRIGGITISANDSGAEVNGQSGSGEAVSVTARDDSAEVRTRAPGEATRQTFVLTDGRASDTGWRMVGYEARGPRGGPIVVATVRVRERGHDRIFDDAKGLVTLNVGR